MPLYVLDRASTWALVQILGSRSIQLTIITFLDGLLMCFRKRLITRYAEVLFFFQLEVPY